MDYIRNDYETILARKEAKEEGSYTCYLFEQGLDKILKKVGCNSGGFNRRSFDACLYE